MDDEEAMVGRLEDLVAKLARPGEGRVRWSCRGDAVAESIIRFVDKREKMVAMLSVLITIRVVGNEKILVASWSSVLNGR